ncbi:DUF736 domain-containing protein [Sphingomonas sp. CJ20]
MITIGAFFADGDGFRGRLETLGLSAALTIVPAGPGGVRNAPDYRLHFGDGAEGPEIGAGWKRTGERAGAYLAIVIDDPQFARPIRANLFRPTIAGQPHLLVWQRAPRRHAPEAQ